MSEAHGGLVEGCMRTSQLISPSLPFLFAGVPSVQTNLHLRVSFPRSARLPWLTISLSSRRLGLPQSDSVV